MRKFYTNYVLPAAVFAVSLLSYGCVDREYSLDNIDGGGSISVGDVITTPPVTAHLTFEGIFGRYGRSGEDTGGERPVVRGHRFRGDVYRRRALSGESAARHSADTGRDDGYVPARGRRQSGTAAGYCQYASHGDGFENRVYRCVRRGRDRFRHDFHSEGRGRAKSSVRRSGWISRM